MQTNDKAQPQKRQRKRIKIRTPYEGIYGREGDILTRISDGLTLQIQTRKQIKGTKKVPKHFIVELLSRRGTQYISSTWWDEYLQREYFLHRGTKHYLHRTSGHMVEIKAEPTKEVRDGN